MAASPEEVLAYWFGPSEGRERDAMGQAQRWFGANADVDREIRQRFGSTLDAALAGELDAWATSPRGRLALVIVLDQFSRNVLRGQARMYGGDAVAQRLAREGFDQGIDAALDYTERLFLSLPLLHSERLADHEYLASIVGRLASDVPDSWAALVEMNTEQVAKYREVIARFGRFPHRNQMLGRTSTQEEREFLEDWAARAAPHAMAAGRSSRHHT